MVIALMVLAIFLVSCAVEEVEVDEAEAALDAIEAVAVPEDSEDSALAGEATTAEKKICKLDSACKSEFYDCYKQDCSAIRNELRKVQQLMKGKRVATNLWFSYKQLKSEFSVCYNVCYDKALEGTIYQVEEGPLVLDNSMISDSHPGLVITGEKNIVLGEDITCQINIASQPGLPVPVCLDINGDDVVFDCQGHTITGNMNSGTGINFDGNNPTVKNCEFSGFAYETFGVN